MVTSFFSKLPVVVGSELKVGYLFCLEPEDTVGPFVALDLVVDVNARVVCGQFIHQLTKDLVVGDDTGKVLVKLFPVGLVGFSEDENTVNVGANDWSKVKDVLIGKDGQHVPVT